MKSSPSPERTTATWYFTLRFFCIVIFYDIFYNNYNSYYLNMALGILLSLSRTWAATLFTTFLLYQWFSLSTRFTMKVILINNSNVWLHRSKRFSCWNSNSFCLGCCYISVSTFLTLYLDGFSFHFIKTQLESEFNLSSRHQQPFSSFVEWRKWWSG